jgi:hypothetical protein
MTFGFNKISYEDQYSKLAKAEDWLNQIGIKIENTRFAEILSLNRLIVEHQKQETLNSLINEYGNLKLWYALTEAASFIKIYEAFEKEKSHIHRRAKLKKMLGGPFLPWDENHEENNIESRNTLFELETAAKIKKAGAKITGFDDVDFIFKKTKFNVQCKRLHSEGNIRHNIEKAASQFNRKMKSKTNLKGIISLSLDKVTGKEEMMLTVKSPHEVRPALARISNDFMNQHRKIWHNLVNINILGILLFVHIVATIEEEPYDLLTTCRDIAFDLIPRQSFFQINDYNLIKELGIRLQNAD